MIRIDDHDAVRLVIFDRPEARNAFDAELYRAAAKALDDACTDDLVSVVVLTGTPPAFSAGQDLKEMARLAAGEPIEVGFPDFLDALVRFDKPLVAAVNGVGVGIGFTMLAHCDLVLIATSARLRTPFAELGVAPEAASSYLFPARMGWQRAAYVLFTSPWLSATEAVEFGIAYAECPDDEVVSRALELAATISTAPLASLRAIKQVMLAAVAPEVSAARSREDAAFQELLGSAATRAALDGFGS